MSFRVTKDTVRPAPVSFKLDGKEIVGYPGETLAAALLGVGIVACRRDGQGRARGPYCNMGTCFECLVEVRATFASNESEDELTRGWVRVRACLAPVVADIEVRSVNRPSAPHPTDVNSND